MSYLVGYGPKYPVHVHHRGASIASIFSLHSEVGCTQGFETWYNRAEPNPNVICGGLVGGPDKNDDFSDDRSNYEQTEPTLSGTAPLVGIFAKLQSLYGKKGEAFCTNLLFFSASFSMKPQSSLFSCLRQVPTIMTHQCPSIKHQVSKRKCLNFDLILEVSSHTISTAFALLF